MRKYDDKEERAIRTQVLVREWTRSGLIEKAQEDRILPELKVELRRTNLFLRLILFAFGILIIGSSVLFAALTFNVHGEAAVATLCLFGAAASLVLAEYLIAAFRLYRFGIEEAAAVGGGILLIFAAGVLASAQRPVRPGDFPILVALIAGSIAGFAIYVRLGYIYAAIASMCCVGLAPFESGLSPEGEHITSAGLLLLVFAVVRSRHRKTGDEFPGDAYSIMQAAAWLGIYASLNLHLSSFGLRFTAPALTGPFYWFTYGAIWLIPAIGLFLAVRERDRPLLDVSIVLGLVTLTTNKPYLGATRQTWDPILLGVLLIGVAVALRRWLSGRDRSGFTATRILLSDKSRISMVGTASAALHTVPQMPNHPAPERKFEGDGGRSGGAGASGSF